MTIFNSVGGGSGDGGSSKFYGPSEVFDLSSLKQGKMYHVLNILRSSSENEQIEIVFKVITAGSSDVALDVYMFNQRATSSSSLLFETLRGGAAQRVTVNYLYYFVYQMPGTLNCTQWAIKTSGNTYYNLTNEQFRWINDGDNSFIITELS